SAQGRPVRGAILAQMESGYCGKACARFVSVS
ncbi:hypothetical protein A2U01_0083831, partial [Trifolium medium]|nr:hypothetical protein [Trifolium medium]